MKIILIAASMVLAASAAKAQIPSCVNIPGGLGSIPECPWNTISTSAYPYDVDLKCHFEAKDNFSCTKIPITENSSAITTEMWNSEMSYHAKMHTMLDFWEKCAANLKCWRWLAPVR